jgi:hypothetical protein
VVSAPNEWRHCIHTHHWALSHLFLFLLLLGTTSLPFLLSTFLQLRIQKIPLLGAALSIPIPFSFSPICSAFKLKVEGLACSAHLGATACDKGMEDRIPIVFITASPLLVLSLGSWPGFWDFVKTTDFLHKKTRRRGVFFFFPSYFS